MLWLRKNKSAISVCFSKLNQFEEEQICDNLRNLREKNHSAEISFSVA